MKKGTIVFLAVLAVLAGVAFYGYAYFNSLRNESIPKETGLNAQYLDNQNYLSTFISGFYEMAGVANLKSEKMDKILTDAVKGRYEGTGVPKGAMFSAIIEAYPDLKSLDVFDKLMDYVAAGREGYRNMQSKLLDMLRAYDAWRETDMIRSYVIKNWLGIPSQRLEARVGTTVARGAEAREKMYLIVLTEKAIDAYTTGKMEPLQIPKQ